MWLAHASNIDQNKFESSSCRPAPLRSKSAEFVPLAARNGRTSSINPLPELKCRHTEDSADFDIRKIARIHSRCLEDFCHSIALNQRDCQRVDLRNIQKNWL